MVTDVLLIGTQIGLLYGPLALGIYLAINVLSLPDLTLEGSFGLGGAAAASSLLMGFDPVSSLLIGMCAGALAGLITALLHVVLQMNVLLAGILMTTAAWSVSIAVMGTGNVSLVRFETLFTWLQALGLGNQQATILMAGGVTLVLALLLVWLLHTGYGLATRATGLNIQTARGMPVTGTLDPATLRARIDLATQAGATETPAFRDWLAANTADLSPEDRTMLEGLAPAAIRDAGGLVIDPVYIDAARRIIAYKESLS